MQLKLKVNILRTCTTIRNLNCKEEVILMEWLDNVFIMRFNVAHTHEHGSSREKKNPVYRRFIFLFVLNFCKYKEKSRLISEWYFDCCI